LALSRALLHHVRGACKLPTHRRWTHLRPPPPTSPFFRACVPLGVPSHGQPRRDCRHVRGGRRPQRAGTVPREPGVTVEDHGQYDVPAPHRAQRHRVLRGVRGKVCVAGHGACSLRPLPTHTAPPPPHAHTRNPLVRRPLHSPPPPALRSVATCWCLTVCAPLSVVLLVVLWLASQLKHSLFEFAVKQRCADTQVLHAVAALLLQEPSVLLVSTATRLRVWRAPPNSLSWCTPCHPVRAC
jgi:hypothetical protein